MFLLVAIPPVFSYYSFIEGEVTKGVVRSIDLTNFYELNLMSFVHAAAGGVMYHESSDPHLVGNTGVLMTLGTHVRKFTDTVGFFNMKENFDIDKMRAYLAYR